MDTALFLPLIGALLVIVAVAVLFLALAYRQLVTHFEKLQRRENQEDTASFEQATKIVEAARHQSHQLLQKSEQKAQNIVIDAEFFTAASQKELQGELQEATSKQLAAYNQMLEKFRNELQHTFADMSTHLEVGSQQQLADFRQSIQQHTQKAEADLAEYLRQNYQLADAEIKAYKQHQVEKIDQNAQKMAEAVLQTVVPKLISNSDHEQLVLQALTEAKQHHAI